MKKNIYETPAVEVVEVCPEGVFCQSGQDMESWNEEKYEW